MKTKFLLPYAYKRIGWILFFPALILASLVFFGDCEPEWLDVKVIKVFPEEMSLFSGKEETKGPVGISENNIANELAGMFLLVSCMLLVFSRTRDEDEFIMKLRLESLLWAALVNGLLVLFAIIFTYDFTFFYVMVFNLYLLFLLFIARFHWVLYKFRKEAVE